MISITATIQPDGDLRVTANNDARAWLKESDAADFWSRLADAFEHYSANGSFTPFEPSDGEQFNAPFVGLTSAPCIAEAYDIDDDGNHSVDGRLWWFPAYALRDPLDELKQRGVTVFTLTDEVG